MSDFRIGGENGQALLVFLLFMGVFFAVAAVVFDVGIWLAERRGASKDADASVLAGVQALVNNGADVNGAFADAVEWAKLNGIDGTKIDPTFETDCSPNNSCINAGDTGCNSSDLAAAPWIEAKIRHPAYAHFISFFGIDSGPDVGALARACVGSPTGHSNLAPFGVETEIEPANGPSEADCENDADDDADTVVDDGCPLSDCMQPDGGGRTLPKYGSVCIMSPPGNGAGVADQQGQILLSETDCSQASSNNLYHDARYASLGICRLGEPVNAGTGPLAPVLAGLEDRLGEERLCDNRFGPSGRNGYDEFQEVFSIVGGSNQLIVPSPDLVFSANDCALTCDPCTNDNSSHNHEYMPRVIDLVLVDRFQTSGSPRITGFASFYVIGCFAQADAEAARSTIQAKVDLDQAFGDDLNRCRNPNSDDRVLGIFTRALAPAIEVKNPDARLPLSIVLVE